MSNVCHELASIRKIWQELNLVVWYMSFSQSFFLAYVVAIPYHQITCKSRQIFFCNVQSMSSSMCIQYAACLQGDSPAQRNPPPPLLSSSHTHFTKYPGIYIYMLLQSQVGDVRRLWSSPDQASWAGSGRGRAGHLKVWPACLHQDKSSQRPQVSPLW